MITGMFAFRPARSISDKSRFTASRGKAADPIPSEKGPASVVPASQAMKCGDRASASSKVSPLMPPPTLPTGEINRICCNSALAISIVSSWCEKFQKSKQQTCKHRPGPQRCLTHWLSKLDDRRHSMYTHSGIICLQFRRSWFAAVDMSVPRHGTYYLSRAAGPFAASPCNRFSWAWARCRRINRSQASGSRATSASRIASWSACPSGIRPGLSAPG